MKPLLLFHAEVSWKNTLKQNPDWYPTSEAHDLAREIMLSQRDHGGCPKNTDFSVDLIQPPEITVINHDAIDVRLSAKSSFLKQGRTCLHSRHSALLKLYLV